MKLPKLYKDPKGYQYFFRNGKKIYRHRRVAEKKYGQLPKEFIVHHIDGHRDNNKKGNLILLHRKDHCRLHKYKTIIISLK